ncbi:MAG: VIT domain-containing protein [Pseudomonadota bacterium]
MLLRLLALVLFLFAGGARAAAPPLMGALNGELPIRLQSLSIASVISGGMAETTVQMVFFNPNGRALEGQLQFPLLDGQQVTGFALDIDGKLRAAVPVAKDKGRQILEAVERRGVDPALLEHTQGNHFKLRVYPIAAHGTRTVELKYAEALARDGAQWLYRLPLAYGERLQDFELDVQVNGAGAAPRAGGALGTLAFAGSGGSYWARVAKSHYVSSGVLTLQLPAAAAPQAYVQQADGETWFVAEIPVSARRAPRALPKVVGLLWDSSGSGAARLHEAELAELDRYFKALGRAEVRLVRLRDRPEAAGVFRVDNGEWDALRRALRATVYDGASALADWQPQAGVGEYVLVSDGLLNYGASRFPSLAPGQRLYALSSALGADNGRLAALAERSGGRLVQVVPDRPGAAAEAMLGDEPQLRNLRADGATDLLADGAGMRQGIVRVAGRLLQASARISFTLVQQGRPQEVSLDVSATAPRHALAATLWAGYKLHELEADYEMQRGAIRRLGAQFGLPTRETSLLVLDRLEDYLRYDVTPPPEYLAAYEKMKALRGGQLAQSRQKQLDSVVRQFEQKVAWWEMHYPKDAPYVPQQKQGAQDAVVSASREESRARPEAPAMMAQPAPIVERAPAPAPAPAAAPASGAVSAQAGVAKSSSSPQAGIALQKWRSDAPYISRMKAASADALYAVYLDEKPSYANSSAFFLDAADLLLERGQRELALRVLSNLAEMELENRHVLRILGYRLLQAGAPKLAIPVFEKVRQLAEEEPQSFRDLGLAYAAAGWRQQAIEQLYEVVLRPWDGRFAEIELIALAEMNALIATAPKGTALDTGGIDPRLLKNLPLALRAVLTWDADNSDMDLWVTDPNGEKCYYGHRLTYQGGRMTRDFTGGYGPEEFSLRVAKPGKYRVEANFFGSNQQLVAGATTLQVKLSSAFGTADASEQMVTMRLTGRGNTVLVGEFEVPAK